MGAENPGDRVPVRALVTFVFVTYALAVGLVLLLVEEFALYPDWEPANWSGVRWFAAGAVIAWCAVGLVLLVVYQRDRWAAAWRAEMADRGERLKWKRFSKRLVAEVVSAMRDVERFNDLRDKLGGEDA